MKPRCGILFLPCALLSSCASSATVPATPTSANIAFVSIPKPGLTQDIPSTSQPIPTATYMPNAQTLRVLIWVRSYLDQTFGNALDEPLRGTFYRWLHKSAEKMVDATLKDWEMWKRENE